MKLVMDASKDKEYQKQHEEAESANRRNRDESEVIRKQERTYRPAYIPEEELEELRKRYTEVIVQDFEDDFHMSKEDREILRKKHRSLLELRQKYTKKIRKIDRFVEACRLVLNIIEETANRNGIMEPEEFRKEVLKGNIIINGLRIPKYTGKGKKTLNWNVVVDYVLNPEKDPKELLTVTNQVESGEMDDIQIKTPEEIEAIIQRAEELEALPEEPLPLNEKDYPDNIALFSGKREAKALKRLLGDPEKILRDLAMEETRYSSDGFRSYTQLQERDLARIQEYHFKHSGKKKQILPEFNGDFSDKDALEAYLFAMDEYDREHDLVEYYGSYVSKADFEELKLKEALERNGYNLRNLYGNKEREKQRKKSEKNDSKKINELKKMLKKMEKQKEKKKKNKTSGFSGEIVTYTREELESGGGINKKKKKASKKAKKSAKAYDYALLGSVGYGGGDIEDYKEEMSSMSLLKGVD